MFDGRELVTGAAMTEEATAADRLLDHFERVAGSPGSLTRVSPPEASAQVFVSVHRGFPEPDSICGFTMGLSNVHSPTSDGPPHRELFIAMTDTREDWAFAVAFLAHQLQGRCGFTTGDVINFREEIAESSRMTGFLVTPAALLGADDADVDQGFRQVAIRQLVPLYESERAWLLDGGDDSAFLGRFSPSQLMDPHRPVFQP